MSDQTSATRVSLADLGRAGPGHRVRAGYDAAQTTTDNSRHWASADGVSPDQLANPGVRQILRNRSRYEYANGSYCKGIVDTLANDAVGIGPELQMLLEDKPLRNEIEQDFWDWSQEIGLPKLLWMMRTGRAHSGEAIGLIGTNPALLSEVKIDVRLVEPEQVTDPLIPMRSATTPEVADGIEFDVYGNAVAYHVLRYHPGGQAYFPWAYANDTIRYDARYILHYFRPDRPGQRRGVPDITPALPLFAELRRYTAAVIAAAETAADFAMTIQTDNTLDVGGNPYVAEPMEVVPLARRMGTVLAPGYKLAQAKAEQPTTGYSEFVDAKIGEIARCINMPFSIAAMSSAKANMSASYLDGQRYGNSVLIDRNGLEFLLNRLLDEWLTEWVRVRRPENLPDRFPRAWRWPNLLHHADPMKVASAAETRLSSGMSSIPWEYAREGRDWEAEQAAAAESLGITVDEYRKLLRDKMFGPAIPAQAPQDNSGDPPPKDNANDNAQ